MATTTNLEKVHVFPSEDSYNTNKTSVGANDLALVPIGTATISEYGLTRLASESDVLGENGEAVVNVPLAYELNDFRRMSKSYSVGDKVNCAFKFEYFLECTQAGTTSAESLDTRNVTFGQEIEDGTVKWIVRAHVKSVNNNVPDANGNITVETGGVKTVNGNKPDEDGNITPSQTGCLPLNGSQAMQGTILCHSGVSFPAISYGNTPTSSGGHMYLFSKDDTNYKGGFILRAVNTNGNVSAELQGTNEGRLFWGGADVATVKGVINTEGYMKFRMWEAGASYAFIWGTFSMTSGESQKTITLPIPIQTIVSAWVNPCNSGGANNNMFIRQNGSQAIDIGKGVGDNNERGGNWGCIAHCIF